MNRPIIISQGFMRLPHAAQALWFHMSARADKNGVISAYTAAELRKELGIGDDAVRELLRNKFITVIDDYTIRIEENATYCGLVVEKDGEDALSYVLFGRELWCKPLRQYTEDVYRREEARERSCGI